MKWILISAILSGGTITYPDEITCRKAVVEILKSTPNGALCIPAGIDESEEAMVKFSKLLDALTKGLGDKTWERQ